MNHNENKQTKKKKKKTKSNKIKRSEVMGLHATEAKIHTKKHQKTPDFDW